MNTPMERAINNEIDRFSLAIDAIDRVPQLQKIGGDSKENFRNQQIACRAYAHQHGGDPPDYGMALASGVNEEEHGPVMSTATRYLPSLENTK